MELKAAQERFVEIYGGEAEFYSFHSPGRVNLIGEHTDYNGGYVFPCALDFGTYGIVSKRDDRRVRFASTDFALQVEICLDSIIYDKADDWANYLKGVILEFQRLGFADKIGGMNILISGNIPNGAGLSSSASIELLMSIILNELFSLNVPRLEMVKLSQRVENNFMGVSSGIMDQYAIGMGRVSQAMLLNCMEMKHEYVPVEIEGYRIVIANTNKRRGLADSKYNERRAECESAVEMLRKKLNINYLGEVSVEIFERNKNVITDTVLRKRAEHVVYEDARVLKAAKSLCEGDLTAFGELMIQSHNSLRDLYEVTGIELDTLVEEALKMEGVAGSRMTGGGFGGCTVSIVKSEMIPQFINEVGKNYAEKIGYSPEFWVASIGDGARML